MSATTKSAPSSSGWKITTPSLIVSNKSRNRRSLAWNAVSASFAVGDILKRFNRADDPAGVIEQGCGGEEQPVRSALEAGKESSAS